MHNRTMRWISGEYRVSFQPVLQPQADPRASLVNAGDRMLHAALDLGVCALFLSPRALGPWRFFYRLAPLDLGVCALFYRLAPLGLGVTRAVMPRLVDTRAFGRSTMVASSFIMCVSTARERLGK